MATKTYIGTTADVSTRTVYTFTNHAIGTASADRWVAVLINAGAAGGRTVSSVTINGVAAQLDSTTNGSFTVPTTYAWLAVPAGTTATIVVTFSGACTGCAVSVYALTGLSSGTPVDSDTSSSPGSGVTLTTPLNGVMLSHITAGAGAMTWTGPTEDFDQGFGTGQISGASKLNTSTSETVSTSASSGRISAIAWRSGYTIAANGGSFTLSGAAAGLNRGLTFAAAAGSFALTGAAATLRRGFQMAADVAALTLVGAVAGLRATRRLSAAGEAFALTGAAAGFFRRTYTLIVDAAAFGLIGGLALFSRVANWTVTQDALATDLAIEPDGPTPSFVVTPDASQSSWTVGD